MTVRIMAQDGLRHTHLKDIIVEQGCMYGHLSCSASQAGFRCKNRCSSHAILSCNEQTVAKRTLMSEQRSMLEQLCHTSRFRNFEMRGSLIDLLARQTDVEHVQLSDILLVVSKEMGELRQLERQRMRSLHDGCRGIVRIVLTHQA